MIGCLNLPPLHGVPFLTDKRKLKTPTPQFWKKCLKTARIVKTTSRDHLKPLWYHTETETPSQLLICLLKIAINLVDHGCNVKQYFLFITTERKDYFFQKKFKYINLFTQLKYHITSLRSHDNCWTQLPDTHCGYDPSHKLN